MVNKLTYLVRDETQVEMVSRYETRDNNGALTGTFKYFGATEPLPIYVSPTGNLCTNMHTEVPPEVGRVLMAFHDGQFDTTKSVT